jgi:hypothetical protein
MLVQVETTSGRRTSPLQFRHPFPVLRHIVLQLLLQLEVPCEKVLPLFLRLVQCY